MHAACLVCALSYKSPSGESFTNKAENIILTVKGVKQIFLICSVCEGRLALLTYRMA